MAKRGRTPKGEFAGKLSHFSTRIQPETRKALEHEAKVSGKSISQVAERLLVSALSDRRMGDLGRAKRAMSYLVAEIAHHIEGIHAQEGRRFRTPFKWRSDPFFYEAFKIAVAQVLEALTPPGEIKPPDLKVHHAESPSDRDWVESFKSPKARGEYVAGHILYSMRTIPFWSAEERDRQRQRLDKMSLTGAREFYSMPDAFRDLTPEPFEHKTVELNRLHLVTWEPEQPEGNGND
jgi:hypothetical protein